MYTKVLQVIGVIGAIVMGLRLGIRATYERIHLTDFPIDMIIYREGVRAYVEHRPVYSEPMAAGDVVLPFIYPPFGAMALMPLSGDNLTNDQAGNIMIVISNGLLALCLFFVFRALSAPRGTTRWFTHAPWYVVFAATVLVWGVMCWIEPVRLNNGFGQINMVIMALVVLDLVPRKRLLPKGSLIGLAAAIKISPLAMLLYFLLRRQFRPIITAIATGFLATLVASLYRFDAAWEFFSTKLLGMGTSGDIGVSTAYQSNSSIKAVIQRAFSSQEAMDNNTLWLNLIWLVLMLCTIAVGAWIMLGLLKRDYHIEAWLIGSFVMLLISPISWSHHWVWLAIALPVFLLRAWLWRAWLLLAVLVLWTVLVLGEPPKWWFGDSIDIFAQPWWVKFLVSDFVWFGLATFGLTAWQLRKMAHQEKVKAPAA